MAEPRLVFTLARKSSLCGALRTPAYAGPHVRTTSASYPGNIQRARPASGLSSLSSLSSYRFGTRDAIQSKTGRWPTLRGIRCLSISNGNAGVHVTRNEFDGGSTATITISNPAKLNIVNVALLQDLAEACRELSEDVNLRSVILTGGLTNKGKAASFIGGMDISEMHQLSSPAAAQELITHVHKACKALRDLPVPVIARVDGFCLGAGLEIMAACDLRICTESSTFGMPEVKIGIPSVVEAALLPGLIGMGRTRRLLYLAENVDGLTAERWGLVEKVVKDKAELDAAVADWVGRIAQMGPLAMRSQKRLMQKWENLFVDDGIDEGIQAFADAFKNGGKEPRELMARFVNRRKNR